MANDVLIRPLITEKLTRLMEEGQYAFEVKREANKIEIRNAVEERYPGVEVAKVRTMVVRGKRKRQYTRRGLVEGREPFYKKAIVTITSGEIDFFENI